jgi:4-amino-4-deoxy-L-arabinose transferase-like glycosyltransferase
MSDPHDTSPDIGGPVACGIVVAAVCAAHANCLGYPFLFDGIPLAEQLRTLTRVEPAGWLLPRPRTFGYLTFELQRTLHGMWMPGYHVVNIAIHAAAACLLGAIVRETLARAAPRLAAWQRDAAALFAALLFGLHPMATHAVTYLYQRFESLMGMLFLASIYCLLRAAAAARPAAWLAACYACFLLALLTKEVAIVLPVALLLFDRCYLSRSWQELWVRRRWLYLAFFATFAAGLAIVLANIDHYRQGGIFFFRRIGLWQYLGTQPEIVGHYVRQALWPDHLCIDPAWPVQDDPRVLAAEWLAVGVVAGTLAWLWRRDKRLAYLPLLGVLVLLPTSSVVTVIDLAFEHRFYLCLAPLAAAVSLAAVVGLPAALGRLGLRDATLRRRATLAILAVVCVALGVATNRRNTVHESLATLWADTALKAPHNTRAWVTLGTVMDAAGRTQEAMDCYVQLVRLYRGAAGREPHPLGAIARRTPRTIEYVWYGYCRLAEEALNRGEAAVARRLYDELVAMPELPNGRLDHPRIKALRERLAAAGQARTPH